MVAFGIVILALLAHSRGSRNRSSGFGCLNSLKTDVVTYETLRGCAGTNGAFALSGSVS